MADNSALLACGKCIAPLAADFDDFVAALNNPSVYLTDARQVLNRKTLRGRL